MNKRRGAFWTVVIQFGGALATLLVISLVVFAGTNIRSPESIARQSLGRTVTEDQVQAFVQENGLDRPAPIRYVEWVGDIAQGNWGDSMSTGQPVMPEILPRLERSLVLAVVALVVSVLIGLLLGILMARRSGQKRDFALLAPLVVVSALPEFVVGLTLITICAVQLGWLPVDSTALTFGSFEQQVAAFVLPVATLACAVVPYIARVTRASVAEALRASYTRAADLRGLSRQRVLWDYAVRNASSPILNAVAVNFIYLLGGVLVVENVFGFPGLGQLLIGAIQRADIVTVQAAATVLGSLVVATNIITDLAAAYLNPRLRERAA